jgi:phenylalanyl-tRNA synthetase alpha chain
MEYTFDDIKNARETLIAKLQQLDDKKAVFRSVEMKALFDQLKTLEPTQKSQFGKEVNQLKIELESMISTIEEREEQVVPIDVTAPMDSNVSSDKRPSILSSSLGSVHPISTEIDRICDIFYRMGFAVEQSREIDDDYHMFASLNFPEGHPARDDWDTFITDDGLIAPAHTSTMQNRVLQKYKTNLDEGEPIAVVVPDRVFRNEDLDATHEHTFHQVEGVFVTQGATVGNLVAVLKTYMSEFFGEELEVKIQPFYFPFTEPSFEFAVTRPAALRKDNSHAEQWLELGGCGMIHPHVLREAGIDPSVYTGFAWGFGVERMIMMRHGMEDIRHFNSGKLEFLRQF